MSGLVPFAVLVSTVRALKGATVVGANVLEAPIDPVETLSATDGARPVVAVYVGSEKHETEGRNLLEGVRRLELAFQIFLPESCAVDVGGQMIRLDTRGLGTELVFSCLWRQCLRALQADDTPWSRCWNRFVVKVHEVESEAFSFEIPGKTRGAAREIIVICDTADEPEYGVAPYPFWADFIDGVRDEPDYGPAIAALIEAEIRAPAGQPTWRITQASQGLSTDTARVLGITPYDATETGEAPVLAAVTAEQRSVDGAPLLTSTGDAAGVSFDRDPA